MEKIRDGIYIDNSKMLLIKLDLIGEKYLTKSDSVFTDFLNSQINPYQDNNYTNKLFSIMPTTATKAEFILSNKCNMGCIYCYSSINRNDNSLGFKHAATVVDRLVSNAVIKNLKIGREKKIYLSFHGGGEPSCEFNLLKDIVDYAKKSTEKNGVKLFLEVTTNLSQQSDEILDYYLKNNFFVHVSMDGIKNVQNYQRPYRDGSKSFAVVNRNISYLAKHDAYFSIRLTVTNYSIAYIIDSVKYLKETYPNVRFIKLAPLEISEISQYNKIYSPKLMEYLKIFEDVDSLLFDIQGDYTGILGETDALINSGMCASVRFEQLIISPEGIITSCHEDPLSEDFRYGTITAEGKMKINSEKVKMLKQDRLNNIINGRCSKCTFRLLCMGGCKHRMQGASRDMFCAIEKHTLTKHIKNAFNENNPNHKCKHIEYVSKENNSMIKFILLEEIL